MGDIGGSDERRDSPAYTDDAEWETVPAPLGAVVSVRFDVGTAAKLAAIARATGRTPSRVVRDWVMERVTTDAQQVQEHRIAEALPSYGTLKGARDANSSEREELRLRYRPASVHLLLVGESAPAGGTFFYTADSNLFEATRAAFSLAFGPMPEGEPFLDEFQRRGAWLYDLTAKPVNRQRGRPRQAAVEAGQAPLAAVLAEERPELVVAVKSTLENVVRGAAGRAALPPHRVHVLPFPLYQWRDVYVRGLAELLRTLNGVRKAGQQESGGSKTLHQAIAQVIDTAGHPVPAREIANRINAGGLYVRADGGPLGYQQVLARARKHPELFLVSRGGISMVGS